MGVEHLDIPLIYMFFLAGAIYIICTFDNDDDIDDSDPDGGAYINE